MVYVLLNAISMSYTAHGICVVECYLYLKHSARYIFCRMLSLSHTLCMVYVLYTNDHVFRVSGLYKTVSISDVL